MPAAQVPAQEVVAVPAPIRRLSAILAVLACTGLAACGPADDGATPAADSHLLVIPQQLNGFAIAGQEVILLVAADQASDLPLTITAEATNAAATVLTPTLAEADGVAEVSVVPDPGTAGTTVTVTITGTGAGGTATSSVSFDVVEGEDDRGERAAEIRDMFVPWLAAAHPELGISAGTAWQGTMVSPQWLVVSHYLFLTDEWEMHVSWHIMVAPDDWARIDLRRRFTELAPSRAFEIPSVTEGSEPVEIAPPEAIWR